MRFLSGEYEEETCAKGRHKQQCNGKARGESLVVLFLQLPFPDDPARTLERIAPNDPARFVAYAS